MPNRHHRHRASRTILTMLFTALTAVVVAGALLATGVPGASAQQDGDVDETALKRKAQAAMDRAYASLAASQNEDGSWGTPERVPVGITALVLTAFAEGPEDLRERYAADLDRAAEYLVSAQQEDGGIYLVTEGLANYQTSISVWALSAYDRDRYAGVINDAVGYLRNTQFTMENPRDPTPKDDPFYGGFRYKPEGPQPDMSNSQFAIEALAAAGVPADDPAMQAALTFIRRCQNYSEGNDLGVALTDPDNHGGWYYKIGESKAGTIEKPDGTVGYKSYGSITYAGMKSMIHCGLEPGDPELQAAVKWIQRHWTLDENPGMSDKRDDVGQQGLFYYYMTLARTLDMMDMDSVMDVDGVEHDWAAELTQVLLEKQTDAGLWVNPEDRWYESDPLVVGPYALIALNHAVDNLGE